jgi:prenyltransferase beta subunit
MSQLSRRSLLARTAAFGLGALAVPTWTRAQQNFADPELTAMDFMTQRTQQAIERGLAYLASRQNEDGSFGSGGYGRNVAICSLAGMAYLAGGSTPGRGPYGEQVGRTVQFILNNTQESGFIILSAAASHGPMYGHGFATLFLAEVYGMSPDSSVREKLAKAVKLIIDTQNNEGGWRYKPQRADADISVTICQVMALRAARNAGIYVPAEAIDRCIDYIKRSQNPDGGFMYMLSQPGPSQFPRSAAGVVALYSTGIYEGEELRKGLEYLSQHLPRGIASSRESHYYYGQYYAVQAMWHAGGGYWHRWYPAIRDVLVELQLENGAWEDMISAEYGTAMACLILQMPNNYLPIFQR